MGNLKLRKIIREETTWKDKNKEEHKCHFVIHCILEIKTKQNIMKYYDVKKCDQCIKMAQCKWLYLWRTYKRTEETSSY